MRLSIDSKAKVKIGNLSRKGKVRRLEALQADDHDDHLAIARVPKQTSLGAEVGIILPPKQTSFRCRSGHHFADGSLAQENFIQETHELIGHIFATLGNQFETLLIELFKQHLRDISFVPKELASQMLSHFWHGFSVIRMAGG